MHNRSSKLFYLFVLFLSYSLSPSYVKGQERSIWRYDFAKAQAEAKAKGLPMLVHFYGDNCPPCVAMEQNVLNTVELRDQLQGKVIPVKVNANRNYALRQKFNVNSWPQDFYVSSDGKIMWHNYKGGMNKYNYLNALARVQTQWDNLHKTQIAKVDQNEALDIQIANGESSYLEERDGNTDKIDTKKKPVGLEGYSPVSLTLHRKWSKGNPGINFEYKGVNYRFASVAEKQQFQEMPRYFAPQLLGCDPVVMMNTDRAIPGKIKFCTFFDERLYIFVSEESRKEFKKDMIKYTRQRHVMLELLSLDQVERY